MGAHKSKVDKGGGNVNVNQVDDNSGGNFPLYSLVNAKGGGELLDLTRKAIKTKNWQPLEEKLRSDAVSIGLLLISQLFSGVIRAFPVFFFFFWGGGGHIAAATGSQGVKWYSPYNFEG